MDTSPKPVIVVDRLTRSFGDFVAVDNVSFSINRGDVIGLLGANGAGKTTAIRMMTGLLRPSFGSLHIAGVDVATHPRELRSKIGYVSQKFSLYGDLTAMENLEFYAGVYGFGRRQWRQRVDQLLAQFPLGGELNFLTRELPMGVRQRLGILCAVLHNPEVLFLDEPTSGVDPLTRREIWILVHKLAAQGITVLVTTHAMEEADYCDRLLIMNRGQLVADGHISELKAQYGGLDMRQIFREVARA
jgi:ABC-2 type transport system ATP-binding protein